MRDLDEKDADCANLAATLILSQVDALEVLDFSAWKSHFNLTEEGEKLEPNVISCNVVFTRFPCAVATIHADEFIANVKNLRAIVRLKYQTALISLAELLRRKAEEIEKVATDVAKA